MVQSRGHAIWLCAIIFPIITGVFLALRLYTRGFISRMLGADDYIAFATMFTIIAYSVLISQATYNGMGDHEADFTEEMTQRYYYWIMIQSEFYCLSLAGYKSSLIFLYLKIFGVDRRFRYACYAVLFYVLGFNLSNMITELAGCTPIQKFWNAKLPGHCINDVAADIAYGAGLMSSDLMIALLPLPMIWRLALRSRREKIGLALVLGGGFIAFIISTARWIVSTVDLVSDDRTWVAGAAFALSIVEINTGLICSCTPALKPLFNIARKQSSAWSARRSSRKQSFTVSKNSNTSVSKGSHVEKSLTKPSISLPDVGIPELDARHITGETSSPDEEYKESHVELDVP